MIGFGFGMAGMEEKLEQITSELAKEHESVTYIEIGVAEGATLTAIAHTLKKSGKPWRAIGIELPNGYSFDMQRTIDNSISRQVKLDFILPNGNIQRPQWETVTVYFRDSQTFLGELWQDDIQLALIDGCHGRPCVKLDFLMLEAWMKPRAMVMFHDYSEEQYGHHQPHCPSGIDVRGAVADLGLANGKRAGWKFIETIPADRSKGGWDMAVFRKE